MTLNDKFGIDVEYNKENDVLYKVHFYDNNGFEIQAYVMDNVEDYQEEILEEIDMVKTASTREDVENLLTRYFGWNLDKCGDVELNFKEFSVTVCE